MGNRPFSRKICNFFCKLTAFYPLRHGFAVPDSPFCRYATSSPGRGKSALKGTPLRYAGKFTVTAEAVPLGKVAATSGSRRKGCSLPAAGSPSPSLLTQCHLSQRERLWRNRTLCSSTGNYTAMPRALPLGELSPKVTERARMLPAECIPNRPSPALHSSPQNDTIAAANHRRRTFFRQMTERGLLL